LGQILNSIKTNLHIRERKMAADKVARGTLWQGWILTVAFTVLLPIGLIIGASGDWNWLWGWLFVAVTVVGFTGSRLIVHRVHPDLLQERVRFTERRDEKAWDRWLTLAAVLLGPFLIYLLSGLDHRYGWSPELPPWLQVAALVVVTLAYGLGTWAMVANRFFSGHVRIQKERGHTVQTEGPYRFVRHPGYVASIISYFGYALMLGSLWALIPALLSNSLLVVRTALEDRTLQNELAGYRAYTRRTRYRLVPGIW
jgi:protein-S-isoprenylcysteine O-methyltransferase Ste14